MVYFGDFCDWDKKLRILDSATTVWWVGITGPELLDLTCGWTAITIDCVAIVAELKALLESVSTFGGTII